MNSDLALLLVKTSTGLSEILHVDTSYIGTKILTKAVGSDLAEDITLTYKYPEGELEHVIRKR